METTSLIITLCVLAAEIGVFLYCRWQLKRPVQPGKVRLIPYGTMMVFLSLAIFVTLAHTVSIVTGTQVMPKNKMVR